MKAPRLFGQPGGAVAHAALTGSRVLSVIGVVVLTAVMAVVQRALAAPVPADGADGMFVRIPPLLGDGGGADAQTLSTWMRLVESGGPFVVVWAVLLGSAIGLYRFVYKPERDAGRVLKAKEIEVQASMAEAAKATAAATLRLSQAAEAMAASAATAAADARVAAEYGLKTVQLLDRRLEVEAARAGS